MAQWSSMNWLLQPSRWVERCGLYLWLMGLDVGWVVCGLGCTCG